MSKKIIVLVGPSGAGKTTLGNTVKKMGIPEIISVTSREMRAYAGEQEGVTYYYVSEEEMLRMKEQGELAEYITYGKNHYGITKKEIQEKVTGGLAFVIAEKDGLEQLKAIYGKDVHAIFVFVDKNTLRDRLIARGESDENVRERLKILDEKGELTHYEHCDFAILNKNLSDSEKQLASIIHIIKEKS